MKNFKNFFIIIMLKSWARGKAPGPSPSAGPGKRNW